MEPDTELIYYSRWVQAHWNNDTFLLGVGFNTDDMAVGFFLGPITIYIGDAEYGDGE